MIKKIIFNAILFILILMFCIYFSNVAEELNGHLFITFIFFYIPIVLISNIIFCCFINSIDFDDNEIISSIRNGYLDKKISKKYNLSTKELNKYKLMAKTNKPYINKYKCCDCDQDGDCSIQNKFILSKKAQCVLWKVAKNDTPFDQIPHA